MNVEFINPFIETIDNILATMASMTCEQGKPYLKADASALGDLTGLLPMAGETVHGSLAISFSEGAIVQITSSMLGEEVESLDDTCRDMTGELTNMLSGGARRLLWQRGFNFDMAQPNSFEGKVAVEHSVMAPVVVIPFKTKAGPFYIEIALGHKLKHAELSA